LLFHLPSSLLPLPYYYITFVLLKYITLIPRVLWKCWLSLNFIIGLILLYPFFWILFSNEKFYRIAFGLMKGWARWIAWTSGIYTSVKKAKPAFSQTPCVYCANHSSYLDILISYLIIPEYFIFMGKREIQTLPLFNIFFKGMNILVNRSSTTDAHKAFTRAMAELEKGNSVFIFPEGGIIFREGKLAEFKNGAFRMAMEKQVPIVPITFKNNFRLLQTGSFFMADARPGISRVMVHAPVETKGMDSKDLVNLRERVFRIINSGF